MWTEELIVGRTDLDEDHREIFRLIEDLRRYFLAEDPGGQAEEILSRLSAYCAAHFRKEEDLMNSLPERPGFDAHRKAHAQFTAEIAKAAEIHRIGGEISADMPMFLDRWWRRHIEGTDRKLLRDLEEAAHRG